MCKIYGEIIKKILKNYINVCYVNNPKDVRLDITLLTYSYSHRVIIEEYYDLFRYFRSKLQDAINNPLKDDVFPMITTA